MNYYGLVITGMLAGIFGGMLGIGGGSVVIPILVLLFGMSQHQAQGTTLAMMVPPVGLLAAWHYYKNGNVDLLTAAILCAGFFIGGLGGAFIAHLIPDFYLKKIFGGFLLAIAVKLIFWS